MKSPSGQGAHLHILEKGVGHWNRWRSENPSVLPDLFEADLRSFSALQGADFSNTDLRGATLNRCNLTQADLTGADLYRGNLWKTILDDALLIEADLSSTTLNGASLRRADLSRANLRFARLAGADVSDAKLSNTSVYASSIWNLKGVPKEQLDIIITPQSEPTVTVDDVEVAQFIYLILSRKNLRKVIDTVITKSVLILGRFSPERKVFLEILAQNLREHGLCPIIFDFDCPTNIDVTETVKVLAGLSLFTIVDLSQPRSSPHELMATVPDFRKPFVTILQEGEKPYSMFTDMQKYQWVVQPLLTYSDAEELTLGFVKCILEPAMRMHEELTLQRHQDLQVRSIKDMLGR